MEVFRKSSTNKALLFIGFSVVLCYVFAISWGEYTRPPGDLYPTYVAARLLLEGHHEAIYHPQIWLSGHEYHPVWTTVALKEGALSSSSSFVYNPGYLILITPLVMWCNSVSFSYVFLFINILSTMLIANETLLLVGVRSQLLSLAAGMIFLRLLPFQVSSYMGQNGLPALALIMLGFRITSVEHGFWRSVTSGVLVALGITCKPWCIFLTGIWLLLRQWRIVFSIIGFYTVINVVLPAVLLPNSLLLAYKNVVNMLSKTVLMAYNDISIRSMIHKLTYRNSQNYLQVWDTSIHIEPQFLIIELVIITLIGVAAAWIILKKRPPHPITFLSSLCLILVPLPICWTHYLVFAAPLSMLCFIDSKAPRLAKVSAAFFLFWMISSNDHAPSGYSNLLEWPFVVLFIHYPLIAVVGMALSSLTSWRGVRSDFVSVAI